MQYFRFVRAAGKKTRFTMPPLTIIGLGLFLLSGCTQEKSPLSAVGQTYQISYGTVTQVDAYPLYVFTYTSGYEFDQYLQSGNFPYYTTVITSSHHFACTCFSAFGGDKSFLGRNYDWSEPSAYYIVHTDPPDGHASVSTVDMTFFNYDYNEPPTSAGNQNTLRLLPYHPFDGMNEKGVAVGMNAIPEGHGPVEEGKITIGELQLIRLVLDYASSTAEALALIRQYNIRMEDPPIHYLIADSAGHSAIIEFVDGQMIVMENEQPWQVTTNFIISDYEDPVHAPCWRYQTAWQTLQNASGILSESAALDLLQQVSLPITRWSALYNLRTGVLQLVMGRKHQNPYAFIVF
jgi:hypothetical protein